MFKFIMTNSDNFKHVMDGVFVTTGTGAVAHNLLNYTGHLVEHVINPMLTSIAIFTTIVWTIYRVIEMHEKRKEKKKEKERNKIDDN